MSRKNRQLRMELDEKTDTRDHGTPPHIEGAPANRPRYAKNALGDVDWVGNSEESAKQVVRRRRRTASKKRQA